MSALLSTVKAHQETEETLNSDMKVYLLFNKSNGAFYTWVSYHAKHGFNKAIFDVAVCESFNPSTQEIQGEWGNWQVIDKVEQPTLIMESTVDQMTASQITERVSVGRQLNTLSEAVIALGKFLGAEQLPELKAVEENLKTIKEILDTGNKRKEGYKRDPSYVFMTQEQQAKNEAKRYEGGLGEIRGPRQVL